MSILGCVYMDIKRYGSIVFLLLIGTLFLTIIHLNDQYCSAAVVWTENFEDGDIDDWTVELGTFSVADGSLRGSTTTNAIRHASTTAYGTWEFDTEVVGMSAVYVSFLAGETSGGIATSCYCLRINRFDMQLLQSTSYQNTLLDTYDPTENIEGWLHIEISRDASGQFTISVNGTQQLTATETTYSTSNYFMFYCNANCALDNIEIDDTTGTTTPTTGTTTPTSPGIPGFPFAAIGIGLLIPISLILVRRRRTIGKMN